MPRCRGVVLATLAAAAFLLAGCSSGITILTYNAGNLFDHVDDGTEYDRFDPGNGKWTRRHFELKVDRLARVIRESAPGGPDIVALQEVENRHALEELCGRLAGYDYRVLVPTPGAPVHCAVISRLPIVRTGVHDVGMWEEVPLRPIMEVEIDCGGHMLVLFNLHWKSKTGGLAETEPARRAAAGVLAERLVSLHERDPGVEALVVGDFNTNVAEYEQVRRAYKTALMPVSARGSAPDRSVLYLSPGETEVEVSAEAVVLYEPWLELSAAERGSAFYRDVPQTPDHMLPGPGLLDETGLRYRPGTFRVVRPREGLDARGFPLHDRELGWHTSDHLPLLLELEVSSPRSR